MLRSLTAKQFQEWQVFYDLFPFGERREDLRFALLVDFLARAQGIKKGDGQPYTGDSYLEALFRFGDDEPAPPTGQSLKFMERELLTWMEASNIAFREGKKVTVQKYG
jgi:hypothetical protein